MKLVQQLRDRLQLEEHREQDLVREKDAALKDVDSLKLQLEAAKQKEQEHLLKLQQHEQWQLDAEHKALAATQAQQQLKQQHQKQMDLLQSQLQQQLQAAHSEASAAQLSLVESERLRTSAEARANRFACFAYWFGSVVSCHLAGAARRLLRPRSSFRLCSSVWNSPVSHCSSFCELKSSHFEQPPL
jgi:hypothetical protein